MALSCLSTTACADLVDSFDVGEGRYTSTVLFQFGNENQYLYTVHFDGTPTGRDLFDVFAEAQEGFFEPEIERWGFGDFLAGLRIGEDHDHGHGTPPDYLDYWHYWTSDEAVGDWTESMIGFSDRLIVDGSRDAWVFNSADAPIPAPPAFLAIAACALTRRRRR